MNKNRILITVGATVIAAVAVIITLVLVLNSGTPKLEKSTVGKQLNTVLTVDNRPASTITVAPATEKWWKTLASTMPAGQLPDTVKWENLKTNAVYVSTAISGGNNYVDYYKYNLSTLMVAYQTNEDALKVAETFPEGVSYYVVGNLIMLPPSEAYIDLDYNAKAFKDVNDRIENGDLNLNGKALMTINLKAMVDNLAATQPKAPEAKFIEKFGTLFGLQDNSYWAGMSPDGTTWTGKFYNVTKFPSPEEISKYYDSAVTVPGPDGNPIHPSELKNPEDYSGFVDTNQASSLLSFSVRTNTSAVGSNTTDLTWAGDTPTPLPTKEGVYQVKMNVNPFLAYMQKRHMTYPYTNMGTLQITVLNTYGDSVIVFKDIKEAAAEDKARIDKAKEYDQYGKDPNAVDDVDKDNSPTPAPTVPSK